MTSLTEHPDITGGGEAPEVDGLGGHPLDGQLTLGGLVVAAVLHPAAEAEVGQLDAVVAVDQGVPRSNVPEESRADGLEVGEKGGCSAKEQSWLNVRKSQQKKVNESESIKICPIGNNK